MKHNPSKLLSLLFAVPFVCMCSKENSNEPASKGEQITITATMSDTKVDLTQGQGELLLTWSEGDALMVIGNTAEKYDIVDDGSGIGTRTATFLGTSVEGEKFIVYYPGTYATVEALTARSYKGQVQTGNGNLGHLEYNSLARGLADFREVNFGADGVLNNGVLKLVVTLPEAVKEVSSISISAPEEIFYTTNGTEEKTATLSLDFENCEIGNDHILTAYMMTSWQDVTIKSGTKLTIGVTVPERLCRYTKTFSNSADINLNGGACLNIDISNAATLDHVLSGSGTQADPYLLYDKEDMSAVRDSLVAGRITYFKMMENIDMTGIDWEGGNQVSPYREDIDFDGDGHTISNFSCTKSGIFSGFIGVLSGRIANVTFETPVVEAKSKHSGIICGYAGSTGTLPAIVENVTIKGGKITQSAGCHTGFIFGHSNVQDCKYTNINIINGVLNQNGIGDSGFIGGAQNIAATYTNCHVSGTLTVKSSLSPTSKDHSTKFCSGGIQGYSAGSTYNNCSFSGNITGTRLCGGIVGYDVKTNLKMTDCHVSDATINTIKVGELSGEVVGGIIGWVEGGTVSKCSFDGSITAGGKEVGGIVGHVKAGTVEDCSNNGEISGSTLVGGIAGYVENGTVSGCSNTADFSSSVTYTAGIVGQQKAGTITGCHNIGNISSSVNYLGGIVGHMLGNVEKCYNMGAITGTAKYNGGIIGFLETGNVDQCFNKGRIQGSECTGGIVGIMSTQTSTTEYVVSNCYNSSDIYSSGQYAGGIIGDARQYTTFKALYSRGTVQGTNVPNNYGRALGGIIGRMANSSSTAKDANYNNKLYYCISYVDKISAAGNTKNYSSGAIVGFTGTKLATSHCYRSASLILECTAKPDGVDMLVNQGHSITEITTGISPGYWYPYHGNAVSGAQFAVGVTPVAQYINTEITGAWDTDIWDFTGNNPTLKNNPEPAAE